MSMSMSGSSPQKNELTNLSKDFESVKNWKEWTAQRVDPLFTEGFKPRLKRGDQRLEGFMNWLFQNKVCANEDIVVICSHSSWLRSFFKSYLPRDSTHMAKTHKIQNCAIVQCQITQFVDSQDPLKKERYCIDEESIKVVRGEFEKFFKAI